MNIDNERKAFEQFCIKDDEFCIHRYAGDPNYSDDYTQCAWLAWLASANREGYKLVPVELIKSCNDIAVDCFNKWDIKKEAMPDICELMQDFSYYLQSHDRSL